MKRAAIFVLRAAEGVVLASLLLAAATIAAAISLARDEDEEHDCGGTCPAHDPGPDDLEAVARVTGLVVFVSPEALIERCIDRLVEGETDDLDDIEALAQQWAKK